MVKRNFPFEKKFGKVSGPTMLDLEHFWSKTKLDLENFHHISFLA